MRNFLGRGASASGILCLLVAGLGPVDGRGAAPPAPRNAPRLLVINDDGFSGFFGGRYRSVADVRRRILRLRDTQVAVLEWCVTCASRVNYRSRATELVGDGVTEFPRRGDRLVHETLKAIADSGVDLTRAVADACREAGIACYASLRMNGDYAPGWMGEVLPRMTNSTFWWAHPEFRVRGRKGEDRTKLSYAFAEVRRFKLAILREAATSGVDGINLDFLRHPPFVGYDAPIIESFRARHGIDPRELPEDDPRWVAARGEVLTAFVREARAALDAAGRSAGRRLGLSARVDWREYRTWGGDIGRWLREGWLDYFVLAQHSLGGYEFDLAPFVALARGTGCAVLFGEEAITSGHDLTAAEDKRIAAGAMKAPARGHLSLEDYRTRAARWYAAGASGIHLFNEDNDAVLRVLGGIDPAR